jgi:hypothetical protein
MKFLCVPCDTAMKLEQKSSPEPGSISLVYSCPACGYEMAMLTNPLETQAVSSLGVTIGVDAGKDPAHAGTAADGATDGAGKCPFTGMVEGLTAGDASRSGFPWTEAAQARMANVPEFVKPMVCSGIERFAREKGYSEVDVKVLDEAKSFLGM